MYQLRILKLFPMLKLSLATAIFLVLPISANALTISPTIKEFEIISSGSAGGKVIVLNDENQKLQIDIEVKNFEAEGETGATRILNESFGLAKWIDTDNKSFVLEPGTKKNVSYKINIPVDAPPGGHFAAILVKAKAITPNEKLGAVLENRIVSLILVRVPGDVIEKGQVKEFFIEQKKWGSLPAKFSVRFENQGNVFLKPYGTVTVRDLSGRKAGEILINDRGGNVLPKSGRRFDAFWDSVSSENTNTKLFFGLYKADLEIFYGSKNFKELASLNLFIFNRKGILLAGALILIILIFAAVFIKKLKKRKFFIERL